MITKLCTLLLCMYTYVYAQNTWNCHTLWFDDGYYCDCNCGIYDPDCNVEDSFDWGCEDNSACIRGECIGENILDVIPPVIVNGDTSMDIVRSYSVLGATDLIIIGSHLISSSEGTYNVMDMTRNSEVNILEEEEELGDEECPNEGPGYIKDCSSEASCCPSTWISDGLCDDENSTYGCDFSCINEEFVDCVDDPIGDSAAISLIFSTLAICMECVLVTISIDF